MCKDCVISPFPERGTTCYDAGSYFLNFKGCKNCQERGSIDIIEKDEEVVDEQESVRFKHICKSCKHVIAEHEYSFSVGEEFQEYEMKCLLCGIGEDSRSIMPEDPRKLVGPLS